MSKLNGIDYLFQGQFKARSSLLTHVKLPKMSLEILEAVKEIENLWKDKNPLCTNTIRLEDLKVLRRSPDLLNNVKIVQGQLQLIMKQILFYHIYGLQAFWSSDLNNPMNTPSNSPVISEEKMFK